MELIIGGYAQGKMEYAVKNSGIGREEFLDGASCTYEQLLSAKGINHFHEYVRRCVIDAGQKQDGVTLDIYTQVEEISSCNPSIVIIADEVGCGVVPMDPVDRNYRETTGRILCKIAKQAKTVHRVYCGIGTKIKE